MVPCAPSACSQGKKRGPSEGMRRDGVSAGAAAQAARRKLDTGREDFYRFQKKEARQSGKNGY